MEVGFYGKLPSHGDFLRRRASDAFVDRWDGWLQQCMSESRTALGPRWLDVYLTSPAWRFVCAPGACGPAPVIGVMVPSVDRAGRYFPLTLVAELPPDVDYAAAATQTSVFFGRAEQLIIETLEADEVDFGRFDDDVLNLGDDLAALRVPKQVVLDARAGAILNGEAPSAWHMPIEVSGQLGSTFEQLLSLRLSLLYKPLVLWWTEGSSNVEPSCLIAAGLPAPGTFSALLDGAWARNQWRSVPARIDRRPVAVDEGSAALASPLRFRSASASDMGRVRQSNQDACVERPEQGLWAVADGMGGHRHGEVASREVCDALGDLVQKPSFDDTIEDAKRRIRAVNDHLFRSSTGPVMTDRSGSTVVTLLVRNTSCAVLWAGDSRIYRCRGGRLEQLTRDHSVEESDALTGRQTTSGITRAVGVQAVVELDVERDEVRAGDRFLLATDGLTRIIPESQIQEWMRHADIRAVADGLVKATLDAGAPDNVTVLVVEALA